jgi:putative membrane protein
MNTRASDEQRIFSIQRPDAKLLTYYALCCLLTGPLFPLFLIPAYFRYHTMRYRFDADGISMRWGVLFRKEIVLSYARFQDIHLSSNVVERWLGLARIEIQTASGSAKAEMTIEGLLEFEFIRDFLYSRMRGQQAGRAGTAGMAAVTSAGDGAGEVVAEVTEALHDLARELRELRDVLGRGAAGPVTSDSPGGEPPGGANS